MIQKSVSRSVRFASAIPAYGLLVFLICLCDTACGQIRNEMRPTQPTSNDPSLVHSPGYSLQQSASQNPNPQQPIVQPNGQRIFPLAANSNSDYQGSVVTKNAANRSEVQPASWTSTLPDAPTSKVNSRAPLEFKSSSKGATTGLEKPKSSWGTTVSMLLSLAVVLSFFLLVAWVIRKSQPASFLKLPGEVVQVLGRTPMAPRQQMYVVRFGSKLLLISHQPGQTQTLGEITDADEVQRLTGQCEANQPGSISNSFRDVLNQVSLGKSSREPKAALRLNR